MPKIKPAAEIAAKWARVAAGRQQDYEMGIKDPSVDWAAAAKSGKDAYEAGIQDSIQRNAFSKGVDAAGNDHWRTKTTMLGAPRWGPGVRAAEGDFQEGFATFAQVIERTQLGPRGPRGDPRNLERAAVMARALSEARRRG